MSLPSFLYLAPEHEASSGALDLPWESRRRFAVGEFARRQGADMPERTVVAAKSWLAHRRVDRRQPILPYGAPAEVDKISPVSASQRYLEHLIGAWNQKFPDAPAEQQLVVLTVPASFDAAARELTREAALAAGLPTELVLLEEPQAAVYSWLAVRGDRWRKDLTAGDRLLVCDIGGGTTDLTLIDVAEQNGELELRRLAVGDHLLVGGDNMDLALAYRVAELFAEQWRETQRLAIGVVVAFVPRCEGIAAGLPNAGNLPGFGTRTWQQAGRQHGHGGRAASAGDRAAGGRVLSCVRADR